MLGAEARALGHGGITAGGASGRASAVTVRGGAAELEAGQGSRRAGPGGPAAGRKRLAETDPGAAARRCWPWWSPHPRGDPESPLRWTAKSVTGTWPVS